MHSASDNPSIGTNSSSTASVTVISDPANEKTIGMQKTGMPLPLIVIAVLAVLVGLKRSKRK
ncbi:MAG: hypothetical protein ACXVH2_04940 [Methanobacterium sp.]